MDDNDDEVAVAVTWVSAILPGGIRITAPEIDLVGVLSECRMRVTCWPCSPISNG